MWTRWWTDRRDGSCWVVQMVVPAGSDDAAKRRTSADEQIVFGRFGMTHRARVDAGVRARFMLLTDDELAALLDAARASSPPPQG
jgi:hypothetical protein